MWIPAFDLRSRVSTSGRALPHRDQCAGELQPHDDPARHRRPTAMNYIPPRLHAYQEVAPSEFLYPIPSHAVPAKFSRTSLEPGCGWSLGDRKRPRLKPYVDVRHGCTWILKEDPHYFLGPDLSLYFSGLETLSLSLITARRRLK